MKAARLSLVGLLVMSGCRGFEENDDDLPPPPPTDVDAGEPDAGQRVEIIYASVEPAYRCGDLSRAFGVAYGIIEAELAHGGTPPPNPHSVDPEDWVDCLMRFRSCQMTLDSRPGWWTDTATEKELKACAPGFPGHSWSWQVGLFDAFLAAEFARGRCYHGEAGPDGSCPATYEQRWLGDGLPAYVRIVDQTPWPSP